jgi:hypothetical protein
MHIFKFLITYLATMLHVASVSESTIMFSLVKKVTDKKSH